MDSSLGEIDLASLPQQLASSEYNPLIFAPMPASVPSSPPRVTFDLPTVRRSEAAPFYMHDGEEDTFYSSRTSSEMDMETGCLVPDGDDAVPDLTTRKTSRRGIYAAYRRWFSRRSAGVQLTEKDLDARHRDRGSRFEWRLQVGSWTAMVVLLLLTIYFLIHES
ncbi:hypothetical protein B0H16DRAFT_678119 [Mycena metata]|uniref:Uncharacterized protein n=1 Tax=Mycena metata TaxID=1033252 RepID=A0AAD7J695_9AGAR|nr:hypothetical protein B0H16DRAFT_678119 [Mycena metata]